VKINMICKVLPRYQEKQSTGVLVYLMEVPNYHVIMLFIIVHVLIEVHDIDVTVCAACKLEFD
jgi:hypothetical protein